MSTEAQSTSALKPGLSIQSILLIMLLVVSMLSSAIIGAIGFINGRESLRDAAFASLTEVRDSRAREVTGLFTTIENTLLVESQGASVTAALADYSAELAASPEPELTAEPTDGAPTEPADNTAALAVHDSYFQHMAEVFGYDDALLVDLDGAVVYSAHDGVDIGTRLLEGTEAFTALARAFEYTMSHDDVDDVVFSDFESTALLERPTAWAVAPIAVDGTITGALAVALPIDEINAVMTTNEDWSSTALGRTGETYLVGEDRLMRSTARELVENPQTYEEDAVASGVKPEDAANAVASHQSLLIQPVRTDAVDLAFANKSGTLIEPNGYLGGETLTSYAPLSIEELNWVIVAQMTTSEAFTPVDDFTKKLAISSAVILFVVAVLSIVLAQIIVRPLKRLKLAARRIAAGEVGVQVNAGRSDELAELGAAFNDMSTSLQVKASLLEEQQKENDRLLSFLMPESVAKRYRDGVKTISQEHQEVTVFYGDILGFEDFGRTMDSEKALSLLNELYRRFDDAAEQHGVERVRTTRQGYLASCGLTVPRVDHARRTVDFALEMQRILARFSGQHGANLRLRAGLDSGTVTSGLVGRAHVSYDLWGDAVNLAFNLQRGTKEAGVFVSERVIERLSDTSDFSPVDEMASADGSQRVWRLTPETTHA